MSLFIVTVPSQFYYFLSYIIGYPDLESYVKRITSMTQSSDVSLTVTSVAIELIKLYILNGENANGESIITKEIENLRSVIILCYICNDKYNINISELKISKNI